MGESISVGNKALKLGMSILNSHPEQLSIENQIELFAEIGFHSIFLSSGVTQDFSKIPFFATLARSLGVVLEAVHAPSWGLDSVWNNGDCEEYKIGLKRIIDECATADIDMLVMHSSGNATQMLNENSFSFFREVETYAQERNVRIAYENSVSTTHLQAVLKDTSIYHGFCYDIGHKNCYTPQDNLIELVGRRMIYTHIHDNGLLSNVDMHLLPFDGKIDWLEEVSALRKIGYKGTLNLELSCTYSSAYQSMSFRQFVKEAYSRLNRLIDILER